jgi:hypothetical protein
MRGVQAVRAPAAAAAAAASPSAASRVPEQLPALLPPSPRRNAGSARSPVEIGSPYRLSTPLGDLPRSQSLPRLPTSSPTATTTTTASSTSSTSTSCSTASSALQLEPPPPSSSVQHVSPAPILRQQSSELLRPRSAAAAHSPVRHPSVHHLHPRGSPPTSAHLRAYAPRPKRMSVTVNPVAQTVTSPVSGQTNPRPMCQLSAGA